MAWTRNFYLRRYTYVLGNVQKEIKEEEEDKANYHC
jgi:hypothetical protein